MVYQTIVDIWESDDALDADAVLAGGLKDTAHEDASDALKVAVGKVI